MKRRFPHILALTLLLVIGWSAWRPAEWGVWWMEMVWVLGTFAVLAATYCRFRFSNLAYGIVFLWLVMHAVGAHYTFERVPVTWLMERLGSERNHYDRIAHFCIGLNSFMLAELAWRRRWATSACVAAVNGVLAIMAMAAGWEIIEWMVAAWDGGADGLAFLGSQGDVWDAQKDMLCDTLGAILAAGLFVVLEKSDVRTDEPEDTNRRGGARDVSRRMAKSSLRKFRHDKSETGSLVYERLFGEWLRTLPCAR